MSRYIFVVFVFLLWPNMTMAESHCDDAEVHVLSNSNSPVLSQLHTGTVRLQKPCVETGMFRISNDKPLEEVDVLHLRNRLKEVFKSTKYQRAAIIFCAGDTKLSCKKAGEIIRYLTQTCKYVFLSVLNKDNQRFHDGGKKLYAKPNHGLYIFKAHPAKHYAEPVKFFGNLNPRTVGRVLCPFELSFSGHTHRDSKSGP